jgi:thiamine biosynthesis lipoprotein
LKYTKGPVAPLFYNKYVLGIEWHMARKAFYIPSLLVIAGIVLLSACSKSDNDMQALTGATMGTTYNIKYMLPAQSLDTNRTELQQLIDQRLLDINQLMSTYLPDSELSQLNQAPANQPFEISIETAQVINTALRLGKLSDGALDITVGPLVNLWGFGPEQRPDKVPTAEQIAKVQPLVGPDKFLLEGKQVTKSDQAVYIDLSTIAKGYAVDQLAEILENNNIRNYLVEIGGEMRVSGTKHGGQDWLVAIEKPITTERSVQRIISIGDNALATSGDYRNYFEEDEVRFSHLIDPKTFKPIQHNLVAVSVIAPRCIEADGLATALIVMGAEKGKLLAEREGIAALFITKEGNEFIEYRSTSFERQVKVIQ